MVFVVVHVIFLAATAFANMATIRVDHFMIDISSSLKRKESHTDEMIVDETESRILWLEMQIIPS